MLQPARAPETGPPTPCRPTYGELDRHHPATRAERRSPVVQHQRPAGRAPRAPRLPTLPAHRRRAPRAAPELSGASTRRPGPAGRTAGRAPRPDPNPAPGSGPPPPSAPPTTSSPPTSAPTATSAPRRPRHHHRHRRRPSPPGRSPCCWSTPPRPPTSSSTPPEPSRPAAPDKPIPLTVFQTLTDANRRILLHAKAALWDLDHELGFPALIEPGPPPGRPPDYRRRPAARSSPRWRRCGPCASCRSTRPTAASRPARPASGTSPASRSRSPTPTWAGCPPRPPGWNDCDAPTPPTSSPPPTAPGTSPART